MNLFHAHDLFKGGKALECGEDEVPFNLEEWDGIIDLSKKGSSRDS